MTVTITSERLPDSLREWRHGDKPLWYEGNLDLLKMPLASVIGTRDASPDGLARTRRITKILVENGFCIVSGLAKGVDTIAHQQALELNGYTIAVLGTPIDECFPKENLGLKERIRHYGLVLSQFPPGSKTYASNFPRRNELMAALSDITIVVEAGEHSGTRYQVRAAVARQKKIGFLASMAEKNYPWVAEALNSGCGILIQKPDDIVDVLTDILNRRRKGGPPRQCSRGEILPLQRTLPLEASLPKPPESPSAQKVADTGRKQDISSGSVTRKTSLWARLKRIALALLRSCNR